MVKTGRSESLGVKDTPGKVRQAVNTIDSMGNAGSTTVIEGMIKVMVISD